LLGPSHPHLIHSPKETAHILFYLYHVGQGKFLLAHRGQGKFKHKTFYELLLESYGIAN
jgi:hypothetical protein